MTNETSKNEVTADDRRFAKYFLLIAFMLSLAAFLGVIRIFIIEIILAAVFATIIFPVFELLLKLFGNRRGVAAFFSCLIVLIVVFIPVFIIFKIVLSQAVDLFQTAEPRLRELAQRGETGIIGQIKSTQVGRWLDIGRIDLNAIVHDAVKNLANTVASVIKTTSRATLRGIIDLFIILFSIFYLLRDGQKIIGKIRSVVPLSSEHKDLIVNKFAAISSATVKGTLLVALIQSFLGTMILLIFGIDAWMLWGIVMFVFALIPFVGPGAVLIPTGVVQIILGDTFHGIAIILLSVFVVSLIDNFLRPRIVGMHDLIVFFSTLGGIVMFGPAGFIIGPLIAAIFLTILNIYLVEFQGHLAFGNRKSGADKQ